MAQIDLSFDIPDNVITKFRERFSGVSANNEADTDFMKVIVKGALKKNYYEVRNKLWHDVNVPLMDAEIDGM